ncbi:hypothetical protein BJ993_001721 [Nocardioides aromaticivorans]|uniref:Uncharacterized protein n=1 Tax=Nocardioides aromaticivorans TaxID=200618 RepID=A0A7Z0CKE3_9ACTN|nr:hypothetical protein [Nocardioides aromaticivorans]NYI44641.1 hypothetical protein [Nocardioides aromaticivorans]
MTISPEKPATQDAERLVSDEQLAATNIPVTRTATVATIGGGLGSFALVDRLRVAGLPTDEIVVVGDATSPGAAFLARCAALGLDDDSRLRSESAARLDNLWGFPGYAGHEARRTRSLRPLAQLLLEGVYGDGYRPTVGIVRDALDREARRIGWRAMTTRVPAEYLFKRSGGGYFVIVRERGELAAIRCDHVHLALGSPGPRVTPEVAAYREQFPDSTLLTTAYDDNDAALATVARRGGDVIVRGAGEAALQLLRRLTEARERHGRDLHVWHVVRSWPDGSSGRDERLGFRHQALDFPRSAYTGSLRDELATLDEPARGAAIEELGAASVRPHRRDPLAAARAEGWYDAVVGEVDRITEQDGRLSASVRLQNGKRMTVNGEHFFDAVGLDTDTAAHPLVADLVAFSPVTTNALGGLRVDEQWAVDGGASGDGRMFATGSTARGALLGPVDSFLGLQQAALSVADTLAAAGVGAPLTPLRSARGWFQWIGGTSL